MSNNWVYRDGHRLTAAMLHDFVALDEEFFRRTGERLRISDGIRTAEEQERIFRDRYRVQATGNGPFNDVRWWQGQRWVRVKDGGTVAAPGSSNHQINIAAGRLGALDIYDTGRDAGILTRGSFRANVFDEIAPGYGYDSEGYAFGENWHKRYNRDPWRRVASAASTGAATSPAPRPTPPPLIIAQEDDMATGVIYTDSKNDKDRRGAVVNTQSGLFSPFSWFSPVYANSLARGFGLPQAASVSVGQFNQLQKDLAALRDTREA